MLRVLLCCREIAQLAAQKANTDVRAADTRRQGHREGLERKRQPYHQRGRAERIHQSHQRRAYPFLIDVLNFELLT